MNKLDSAMGSAYAALVAAPMFWAGNFVVGRLVNAETDPLTLNALRWSTVTLLLVPVLYFDREQIMTVLRHQWRATVVLAFSGVVCFNTILYAGLSYTGAGVAGVLFGLTPLLIVAFAGLWDRRAMSGKAAAGACVALIGVFLIVFVPQGDGARSMIGSGLVLLAGVFWALYTVALKQLPLGLRPVSALALLSMVGTLLMTPVLVWGDPVQTLRQPGVLPAVAYLALGASIIAFCAWQRGVQAVGAARAGVFLHLIPAFGVGFGALMLGEEITQAKLGGLALILCGVLLAQSRTGMLPPMGEARTPSVQGTTGRLSRSATSKRSAHASRFAEG